MSELEVLASLLGSISWWPASSSGQAQWHARPQGPLLWFHALTLGETAVVLPVVFRCLLEYNEHVHVLLTTKSAEAISLLSTSLPPRVIVQDVPLDNYFSMRCFLAHFQPQACILMESPAWPVLVQCCAARGIRLGLLNARMSSRAFLSWFQPRVSRGLLRRMLGHFSLVVPQSDIDVGRFRIFGATLQQMPGWCSDLKYAAALGNSVWHLWRPKPSRIASLRSALCGRPLWVAAHTQPGEEEAVATVHGTVAKDWPSLLTVLAPAASGRCAEVAEMLETIHSLKVVVWSSVVDAVAPQAHKQQQPQQQQHTSRGSSWLLGWGGSSSGSGSGRAGSSSRDAEGQHRQQHGQAGGAAAAAAAGSSGRSGAVEDPAMLLKGVDVLLLDLQADLPLMYSVSEVAFIGSSLLEGCSGHNLAEAAVAGCAVLVGEHAGHFSTMADELNQAAVVAAEEASAAVNSSGPMEDPFFAAAAAAADTGAGSSGPAAAGTSGAGAAGASSSSAAASGEHAVVQGAESEEPSPRDGSHWRGVLNYTQQHEEEQELHGQQHYHDSSSGGGGGVRDHGSSGFSSLLQLQQQQQQHHHQHQQLHTLLQQQQSSPRPSSAPAAVSNAGGAPSSSSGRALAAPAAAPESSDGDAYNPVEARNTAALLYRRHARTGSSANSSRVNSPVASLRPSTAGGSAYCQQQQQPQQALPPQQPQSQQWLDSGSYLQQYQQQQQQQQQQGPGPSPLSQQSSITNQQAPSLQQQPQRQPHSAAAAAAGRSTGGGSTFQEGAGPFPCYPAAADLPVPQAPPPSAATNTPVNGPTGNVTPVTPAGSFGGADPAHLQHPDSRDLALRLAQQQQQQGAATPPQRESDPSTAPLQPQGGKQQQQQAVGDSGGASHQQQQQRAHTDDSCLQLQLQHGANNNSSSGGGGVSNAGSTPLSSVADLYSMPFASSSSPRGLNLPHTPHTTPEDSAHTMGGRSPMLSGAGVSYTPADLAGLVALQTPTEPFTSLPSLEPSWQSAASSNGSNSGICCAGGGATDSSRSSTAPARSSLGNGSSSGGGGGCGGQQQQSWPPTQDAAGGSFSDHSYQVASSLQRPGCPTPPEGPCFSRASAASTVSTNLPVTFSNGSSSSSANGRSSSSRSRLGRAISNGGWAEEQQRQRHRRHLQGVVNGVWRGGSEGGSPMVASLAESSAAGELSSSDKSDGDGGESAGVDGRSSGRRMGSSDAPVYPARPDSPPPQAAAGAAGTAAAPGGVDAALPAAAAAAAAADGTPGEEEGVLAVSLTGASSGCGCGRLSEESSGLLFEGEASEGEGDLLDGHGGRTGAGVAEEGGECGGPFSRSPTFAELAACHSSSSTDGNGNAAAAAGGGGAGKQGPLAAAAAAVLSASISGGSVSAKQGPQTSSNGCSSSSRSSSQEQEDLYIPNLCPMERQLQLQQQQQQARSASDQGSVGWEDWGQTQQRAQDDSSSNNGAVAASTAAATAATAAAPMRSSDGGGTAAAGASRLGDPRRSRHFLDVPSESSSVAEDSEIQPVAGQQQQQQQEGLGAGAQQQQRQPLSGSGSGGASVLPVRHLNGQGQPAAAAAAGSSAGASSLGGVYSSSSGGGGGGVWLDPTHSGAATPTRSRAYHQAYQYHHSASSTPSAGVTPRGARGQQQPSRAGSSHQGYHHHQQQHQYYNHHHQQQQLSGRRSVDLQQQQHFGQHMHHYQHLDGSSGGGSGAGMFSPLARLVGGGDSSSYRRAESVTSMTSFATSAGGDRDLLLLHDDQPGSSRMSLLGEHSHGSTHLGGHSTTGGGRFSGFTGGPGFASTGRFSECATPRSAVTDVFRGHSEPQGGAPFGGGGGGGDAGGLLSPGTSYLRYRGEYILPATHLPSAPQGPAVWRVSGTSGLSLALNSLLQEPLERRSRGHAAAQAAAKLASGLVSTVWHVVDDLVVTPALQEFVAQGGLSGDAAAQHAARAPRFPGHPRH